MPKPVASVVIGCFRINNRPVLPHRLTSQKFFSFSLSLEKLILSQICQHVVHWFVFHRTDFFSGLGWMLLRQFWLEIREGWPDIFWDEYLRKPYVRKNRSCLRPEVSRTITFGRMGISKGQFFDAYLKTMILNNQWQNFLRMDLSYLHEPNYTRRWLDSVYNMSVEIPLSQFLKDDLPLILTTPARRIRVTYKSQIDFNQIAVKLNLMNDIKSGVMRNAFAGVVPVKWKNQWIYIAPPPTWTDYDQSWT